MTARPRLPVSSARPPWSLNGAEAGRTMSTSVLTALADKVLTPERLKEMLRELKARLKKAQSGQDDQARVLQRELAESAREHARDEGYAFLGPVETELVIEPAQRTGTFSIEARFREVWAHADVELTSSCLCLPGQ